MTTANRRSFGQGGALIVGMIVVSMVGVVAATAVATGVLGRNRAVATRTVAESRFTAEGGSSYLLRELGKVRLHYFDTAGSFAGDLSTQVGIRLNGKTHLGGQTVTATPTGISIPSMTLSGGTVSGTVTWLRSDLARMNISALRNGSPYRVQADMDIRQVPSGAFSYGLASKGQIEVSGNAKILGADPYPGDGSVLSATAASLEAVIVGGSSTVSGDIYAAAPGAYVSVQSSPEIAGSRDPAVWSQHIHNGVEAPDFPIPDTEAIRLAVPSASWTVVDPATFNQGSKQTYKNLYIKAGTKAVVFNDKTVVEGILFIESPNEVEFSGGSTLRGMIVTRDSGQPISACQLRFRGNVDAYGVETLSSTDPAFTQVRRQTGSFIVAPGFGVSFLSSILFNNGTIAADKLEFSGNATGTVRGSIIGLKDQKTTVGGSVEVVFARTGASGMPAGFRPTAQLVAGRNTYRENPR